MDNLLCFFRDVALWLLPQISCRFRKFQFQMVLVFQCIPRYFVSDYLKEFCKNFDTQFIGRGSSFCWETMSFTLSNWTFLSLSLVYLEERLPIFMNKINNIIEKIGASMRSLYFVSLFYMKERNSRFKCWIKIVLQLFNMWWLYVMRHYGYRCFRKSCKFKIVKFYLDGIKIIFVALIILISQ